MQEPSWLSGCQLDSTLASGLQILLLLVVVGQARFISGVQTSLELRPASEAGIAD